MRILFKSKVSRQSSNIMADYHFKDSVGVWIAKKKKVSKSKFWLCLKQEKIFGTHTCTGLVSWLVLTTIADCVFHKKLKLKSETYWYYFVRKSQRITEQMLECYSVFNLVGKVRCNRHKTTVMLSLHTSQVAHQARALPGLCIIKKLGVFLLPLDGMLLHFRATPGVKLLVPIYTPGWRENKVSCPRSQHNAPG